jgi:REP element-mobilizing transposase RayT
MARGLERRAIFRDDHDRQAFVDRLATLARATQTRVCAWALLPNHLHLLARSGPAGLSTLMQRLLGGYAGAFNRRHGRHGHLLQNRFKSILVDEQAYLLELVRYLHLNPVRAGLVGELDELERYAWTGHSRLMGRVKDGWQDVDWVLAQFGRQVGAARRAYRQFVWEGWNQGHRPELEGGGIRRSRAGWQRLAALGRGRERWAADERVLGNGEFVEAVLAEHERSAMVRRPQPAEAAQLIRRITERVAVVCAVEPTAIASRTKERPVVAARAVVSYLAVRHAQLPLVLVARQLGVSPSTIMRGARVGKQVIDKRGVLVTDLLAADDLAAVNAS